MGDIGELTQKFIKLRDEREWKQFHNPKDEAADIAIEASELLELFVWKKPEELEKVLKEKREQVEQELADIFISALLFAHDAGIDVKKVVERKIDLIAQKYPVEKSKGKNVKYTEL